MKKLFLFIVPVISVIVSCNSEPKEIDTRPATELALIKKFSDADSICKTQVNKVVKKEFIEKSKKQLIDFIVKDLNAKAENWEAHVHEIKPGVLGVDAEFLISKEREFGDDVKYPDMESIVLESDEIQDPKLTEVLKTLREGDKVLISGTFDTRPFDSGSVVFQTMTRVTLDSADELSNPSFVFHLTDVKRIEKEKL
ncbi:MAG: hypothetical protein EOP47_04590 [Sphingobacteriaceae bacterium]|nr:MAG: hypothetical protein EOP47_04590 [Sphingobacteriaceae bacterium]